MVSRLDLHSHLCKLLHLFSFCNLNCISRRNTELILKTENKSIEQFTILNKRSVSQSAVFILHSAFNSILFLCSWKCPKEIKSSYSESLKSPLRNHKLMRNHEAFTIYVHPYIFLANGTLILIQINNFTFLEFKSQPIRINLKLQLS